MRAGGRAEVERVDADHGQERGRRALDGRDAGEHRPVALSTVGQLLNRAAHPVHTLADTLYDRLLLHLGKLSLRSVVALPPPPTHDPLALMKWPRHSSSWLQPSSEGLGAATAVGLARAVRPSTSNRAMSTRLVDNSKVAWNIALATSFLGLRAGVLGVLVAPGLALQLKLLLGVLVERQG